MNTTVELNSTYNCRPLNQLNQSLETTTMNMLASLATDTSIAGEKDSVGGFALLDSGLYNGTVSLAYLGASDGGAMSLNLSLKTTDGVEVNQQLWLTSGTAKGCKNFYEKGGVKHYLPDFLLANSLCQLAVGKEISQLDTEDKIVQVWSKDAGAKVPTKVKMITDLLNQEISFGILKQTVDKNVKNDAGAYVASGETRDENRIDKFFRASDKMTVAEIRAKAEEASFAAVWAAKYAGQIINKAKGATAGGGTAGAPKAGAAAAAGKPKTSLFSA